MPLSNLMTPGRVIIFLDNLSYSLGAFMADYSPTHLFNPNWPPHARFHNGQTMSLGTLLAITSTYFLFRSSTYTSSAGDRKSAAAEKNAGNSNRNSNASALADLFAAAWIGSLYCAAGLSAIWYPGTEWTDPEFYQEGQMTQMPLFSGIVGVMWVGYAIEWWRLGGV